LIPQDDIEWLPAPEDQMLGEYDLRVDPPSECNNPSIISLKGVHTASSIEASGYYVVCQPTPEKILSAKKFLMEKLTRRIEVKLKSQSKSR
jgi:hypothetical protein